MLARFLFFFSSSKPATLTPTQEMDLKRQLCDGDANSLVLDLLPMVSKCKKKMGRQTWSEETMQQAIRAVKENKMGWLKASQLYNIPRTTLRRRARKLKNAGGISKSPLKSKTAQPREAKEDSAPVCQKFFNGL
uniref:HTH psq-type domain-containing protein n=2 Tax=Timema TaxID=61471 RepID=A0A7R9NZT0_9NEOP|nr:unnamed protein product [Timema bartmani]CAD7462365.1 unnamed protein product [Timema tahoe]